MDPPTPTKKRAADTTPPDTTSTPLVLHRHHHRLPARTQQTPPFNIYKSLLRHPNLFFQLTLRLPYPQLLSLYAIDKEFHYRVNKFSLSLTHEYAARHAPLASRIFSWSLYPQLCISDPQLRPMDARAWLARDVPAFRWLGMVLARQRTVRAVLTALARAGHRVPVRAEPVLMKLWVLMETRTAGVRRATLQDERVWADADVAVLQLVLVKLDMRFTDPVLGNGVCALSRLLLAQPDLRLLERVLTGRETLDYDDVLDLLLRTYLPEDLDLETHPWLADPDMHDVLQDEIGLLCREGWHSRGRRMETAVDMVIVEGIRRGLHVQQYLLDFVLYGTVGRNGENIPLPRRWRADKGIMMPAEGWPVESVRRAMLARLDERVRGAEARSERSA